jgi:DNA adenine methylase
MSQIPIWTNTERVINVASVPKRSPFRYPGGKTWLVPRIRQWLVSLPHKASELVEPFAGGGIVSLTAAAERLVDHVTMVELDSQVAAVWETIFNDRDGAEWLTERIITFNLTPESVATELSTVPTSAREQAFQTIVRNRVNHGGILAPGAGLLKNGEAGKGLKSRWYPATLRKRILELLNYREHITFISGDGVEVLNRFVERADIAVFIDPPYTASRKRAGSRLYNCPDIEHEALFQLCAQMKGDFLMTYDNAEEVQALAKHFGFDTQPIAMKNTHHATMTELLIGRDLTWIRQMTYEQ